MMAGEMIAREGECEVECDLRYNWDPGFGEAGLRGWMDGHSWVYHIVSGWGW